MAVSFTSGNDFIIPTEDGQTYLGGAGNDTYILSENTIVPNGTIVIQDTEGINEIQLVGGLTIASSEVYNNAIELTLSNGAVVQIVGAAAFGFNVGGNALAGIPGTDQTFTEFVESTLGTTVPAEGEDPTTGGEVEIPGGTVEPEAPTFSVSTADVEEGGMATFTITLSEAQAEATTVDYAISLEGGASAADHGDITVDSVVDNTGSGTLTFAAGETTKVITIPVTEDDLSPEEGEGITVTLSNPTGADAELGEAAAATAGIIDVPVTFELTQDPASVQEGDTVTYTLTASVAVSADTEVSFAVVPGDATAADQGTNDTNLNDFSQGAFNPVTVTMAAGETTVQFTLDTENDGITELPEDFSVEATIGGEVVDSITTSLLDGGGAEEGETFTLTAGSDTGAAFTGTVYNDTYDAPVVQDGAGNLTDTLQNVDQLNGGAGTDTLNATLNAPVGGTVTPSLTGIEVVNVRATGASILDLSASTGVTNVNVNNSSAVATLTKIGNAAVGVANQNQNVNINGSTATALALNLDTVGTKTTDINVDLGSATANAATSFAITAKDAHVTFIETTASAATTSTSVAATGSNEITFAAADLASITSLTVTGAGDVDFTGAAMTALKTLTAGDGGVKVDATGGVLETVTAGAGKDTVTAVGATVKSISTGAGNDTVNQVTTDLAATATVDLGAGDDSIVFGTKFAAGATVSGGEGTDTIGLAKANYALVAAYTDANLAKVTGFEVLSITDALATGDTIDVSKIAGITSFKAAAGVTTANSAAVSNLGANTSVELAGAGANNGTLTATLKTNTAADAMTLVLNKDYVDNNDTTADNNAYAHTVVAAEIESLTVNSTGKQTATFTPVDGYKADTVTNTLTLDGSNALTDVTVTGDQKLVLASTAAMTKLATVDGSANTGGLDFNGSLADMTTPTTSVAMTISGSATAANTLVGTGHADTITGGAKVDTITGGKGGDTLTGNGGNDMFVFAAGDSAIGTGTFDTITDFVANTWGNGTGGAAGTEADLTDATKVTGDVLSFTVAGTANAVNGIKVFVASSAADATTFLANTASADNTQSSAALDSTSNKLYVDVSGDGVTDFYISLSGVTSIDAAAFDIN